MTEQQRTHNPSAQEPAPTLADRATEALSTIRRGWPHVLDPIETRSTSASQTRPRHATEDEADADQSLDARADTGRLLAFWVHAMVDEWPAVLQHLEAGVDGKLIVVTDTIDCTNVPAMAQLLAGETDRLADWAQPGHDYGQTFVDDVEQIARAVSRVAWPPKGDRITIGDCPTCGRRVRVKAPTWHQQPVPQPTTAPGHYAPWVVLPGTEWEPARDRTITCRCGADYTLEGWREAIAGPATPLTADELVGVIRDQLGMRYGSATVRQWARRGFIAAAGYSPQGHALYDRTQVLAALMAREREREQAS